MTDGAEIVVVETAGSPTDDTDIVLFNPNVGTDVAAEDPNNGAEDAEDEEESPLNSGKAFEELKLVAATEEDRGIVAPLNKELEDGTVLPRSVDAEILEVDKLNPLKRGVELVVLGMDTPKVKEVLEAGVPKLNPPGCDELPAENPVEAGKEKPVVEAGNPNPTFEAGRETPVLKAGRENPEFGVDKENLLDPGAENPAAEEAEIPALVLIAVNELLALKLLPKVTLLVGFVVAVEVLKENPLKTGCLDVSVG